MNGCIFCCVDSSDWNVPCCPVLSQDSVSAGLSPMAPPWKRHLVAESWQQKANALRVFVLLTISERQREH